MAKFTNWLDRAKQAAQGLKTEYEAGQRGDDSPVTPLWASPRGQLDAVLGLLRSARASSDAASSPSGASPSGASRAERDIGSDATDAGDAEELGSAIRSVDWAGVRAATTDKGADAARVMKSMADQVDWTRVTPVASQVSSALIAAVASGHLPVGGRLGSTVARAIVDQRGMGQRVGDQLRADDVPIPTDFRGILDAIETTGRESER